MEAAVHKRRWALHKKLYLSSVPQRKKLFTSFPALTYISQHPENSGFLKVLNTYFIIYDNHLCGPTNAHSSYTLSLKTEENTELLPCDD